jgi:16S rRNA (guanine527-N7)-methyltransferase
MEPQLPDWAHAPVNRYLDLLERWNRIHALTALDPDRRFEELVLDSAALLPFLAPLAPGCRVIDFGTGMGIPAVPLAILRPDLELVALDASRKKIAFVRQAALELGLANLRPLAARAEELAPQEADAGVAKAVGSLELLAGWWRRHGRPGAPFLALKGGGEAEAFPAGCSVQTHPYRLPSRGERAVLELRFSG